MNIIWLSYVDSFSHFKINNVSIVPGEVTKTPDSSLGSREANPVLLPAIALGRVGSLFCLGRGRRHVTSHHPDQALLVVTTIQEDSYYWRPHNPLPPSLEPHLYQGPGRHSNQ